MKKALTFILVLCLTLSLCMPATAANGFSDVSADSWAYKQIDYLSGQNVLSGYENGEFRPDNQVSRAEYITMMVKLFGLKETAAIDFTNVPAWAVENVQKAKAQGFLLDYTKNTDFNEKLTREEAVSLLMRYLDISSSTSYAGITDISSVSSEYRDYVSAAVANSIIRGYTDGSFKPKNILTRAEALTMLYNAAGKLYSYACSYANNAPANNVTINGTIALEEKLLSGRVIITEGVSYAMLTKCTVNGIVYDRGADLILDNTNLSELNVYGDGEVTLTNGSKVTKINVYGSAKININEECSVTDIYVNKSAADTQIVGKGKVNKIWVYAEGVVSTILPSEYYIEKGLIATFNGVSYAAGSGKTSLTGITSAYVSGGAYLYDKFKSNYDKYITIEVTAQIDGIVYAAAWERGTSTLSAEQIAYYTNESKQVKAGETVQFVLDAQNGYNAYNVGVVMKTKNGKDLITLKPLYNTSVISLSKQSMDTAEPGNSKSGTPSWKLYIYDGAIYIEFNQDMYYDGYRVSYALNELNSTELAKLFSVKTVKYLGGSSFLPTYTDLTFTATCQNVKNASSVATVVRLDVTDGLAKGSTYVVTISDSISNRSDAKPANNYDMVYFA